ncbi:MAG TPA: transglycosylase SLT domain-containing protein [Bryobacteraceae bacterium]|nr:transglycosylase SLT domain-containing protein [Bryobacteraceae bacterium]
MDFMPAAPKQAIASSVIDSPQVVPVVTVAESPSYLKSTLQLPPKPTAVDVRLRQVDERFSAGKKAYQDGDIATARAEFDKAIDLLLTTPDNHPDRYKIEKKVEDLVAAIHKYDVNGMGAGDFSVQTAYDKAPLEDILEMTFPVDPTLTPRVKEQLQATVSQLPLQMTDAVLSYINYFSSDRGRNTLLAGLRRAGRYKPLIQKILAEEGVPQELIYLAQAESGFLPRAMSNKAAVGMWQFIKWRGRQYGLNQTAYTDDRLDPEKSTRSAAKHLRDLYEKFGDWYLAIAGYNCGDGCVEKAVQRTGYADFWDLRARNAIPKETTNYVPIILAMTIMHKNAKDYGIENIETDAPLTYDTIEVDAPTHLALVADIADRPVSDLRDMTPSVLGSVAPAGFQLHVPEGAKGNVLAALETIPAERRASWRVHRVGPGDTLESIARRFNMPVNSIASINDQSEAEIGDVLIIPTASQVERTKATPKKQNRASLGKASTRKAAKASAQPVRSAKRPASRRMASAFASGAGMQ